MIDKDENKADELPEVGRRDRPRRHSSTARVEAAPRFGIARQLQKMVFTRAMTQQRFLGAPDGRVAPQRAEH
jgi:hypothetical protein